MLFFIFSSTSMTFVWNFYIHVAKWFLRYAFFHSSPDEDYGYIYISITYVKFFLQIIVIVIHITTYRLLSFVFSNCLYDNLNVISLPLNSVHHSCTKIMEVDIHFVLKIILTPFLKANISQNLKSKNIQFPPSLCSNFFL